MMDHVELFKAADIVVLNNVFEFFADIPGQQKLWTFLFQNLRKPGLLVVSNPALTDALSAAQV